MPAPRICRTCLSSAYWLDDLTWHAVPLLESYHCRPLGWDSKVSGHRIAADDTRRKGPGAFWTFQHRPFRNPVVCQDSKSRLFEPNDSFLIVADQSTRLFKVGQSFRLLILETPVNPAPSGTCYRVPTCSLSCKSGATSSYKGPGGWSPTSSRGATLKRGPRPRAKVTGAPAV